MFGIILIGAYLLRCCARIFSQTFKDGEYNWKDIIKYSTDMHTPKVLVVATSHKTRGGITSVVKAHETSEQWKSIIVSGLRHIEMEII